MGNEITRILTLNMNMFNSQIDNSFQNFLEEYSPDLAIIQECRSTKISKIKYYKINPNQYGLNEEINGTLYITMAFCKDKTWNRVITKKLKNYGNRYVEIGTQKGKAHNEWSVLGVHIPAETKNNKDILKDLISFIKSSNCDIICGDFNASRRKPKSINWKLLEELIKSKKYIDLWEKGLKEKKAYYIDYKGNEYEADENSIYKTFIGNTHIDYIIGKNVELIKIIIDMRTLAFTDHCALIIDCIAISD